jgi:hypothetical protein
MIIFMNDFNLFAFSLFDHKLLLFCINAIMRIIFGSKCVCVCTRAHVCPSRESAIK